MNFKEYLNRYEIVESLESMISDNIILTEGIDDKSMKLSSGEAAADMALNVAKNKMIEKSGDKLYKLIYKVAKKIPNAKVKSLVILLAIAAKKSGLSTSTIMKLFNVQGLKRIVKLIKDNIIDNKMINNAIATMKDDRYKGDKGLAKYANDLAKNNPELLNKAKSVVNTAIKG